MKKTDLKERVIDALESGGYKDFYSRYFNRNDKKDIWQVICPFHFDHNPSLNINTLNGLYNCFGCGKKGDVFSFRMIKENLNFKECLGKFAKEFLRNGKTDYTEEINQFDEEYFPASGITLERLKNEFSLVEIDSHRPQELPTGQTLSDKKSELHLIRISEQTPMDAQTGIPEVKKNIDTPSVTPETENKKTDVKDENEDTYTNEKLEPKDLAVIKNVIGWSRYLLSGSSNEALAFLNNIRGLDNYTLDKYLIGYDPRRKVITIPCLGVNTDKISTIKFFKYDFKAGTKKITCRGKAQLFGLNYFLMEYYKKDQVIIAEGEFDALLLNRMGFVAVTGTAGAGTWNDEWNKYFKDKNVVVCYDSDEPGRKGSENTVRNLLPYVNSIKNIILFKENVSKDQKDITDYFLKSKHSIDDFIKLIDSAEDNKHKPDGVSCEAYYDLKAQEDELEIYSSQDFFKGDLYYAVKIRRDTYLINSKKQLLPVKDLIKEGMLEGLPDIDTFKFSKEGILDYVHGKSYVNPVFLYNDILNYIKKYIFLKDPRSYVFLSLWAIGTYVFKIFRYYPYVHLNAEKGSGKTLLMEILAPVCYNGQISCNASEAVIYRDIQNNSLTLFLDEIERLNKEDKDKMNAIMNVLKTGFSKSGLVKRCSGKNNEKISKFSTYSPKMFAGIKDIDDVLLDRAVRIPMVRKLETEPTDRYTESESNLQFQKDIRDKLYVFGLTYANEISDTYTNLSDELEGLEHLNNRELDIWLPIFILANLVDKTSKYAGETISGIMKEYSIDMLKYKKENDTYKNDTVMLLKILNSLIIDLTPEKEAGSEKTYSTDSVFDYFKEQDEFDWLANKSWLTKKLRALNIVNVNTRFQNKQRRFYLIDTKLLAELSSRYSVPFPVQEL